MLSLNEFIYELTLYMQENLPESYKYFKIVQKNFNKNNQILVGLTDAYADYCKGVSIDTIKDSITSAFNESLLHTPSIEETALFSPDNIFPALVNTEKNRELLKDCPHREFSDLSVVYRVKLDLGERGRGSALINNSIMASFELNEEELYKKALENLKDKENKPSAKKMMEILLNPNSEESIDLQTENIDSSELIVITNDDRTLGANALLDKEFMSDLGKAFGSDVYILPSSIHECICISANADIKLSDLRNMVKEVNATEVAPGDFLSDSVYFYDRKEQTVKEALTNRELLELNKVKFVTENGEDIF